VLKKPAFFSVCVQCVCTTIRRFIATRLHFAILQLPTFIGFSLLVLLLLPLIQASSPMLLQTFEHETLQKSNENVKEDSTLEKDK